jgi:hypothetical protein
MTAILAVSAVLLFLLTVGQLRFPASRIQTMVAIAALVLYLFLLHFAFGFPALPTNFAKGGPEADLGPLVLAMYVFMLLGMGAEYLYHYLDAKPSVRKLDWGGFVKPIIVSPMVFGPLAASLLTAKVDLSRFNIPLLMLYIVAFENGFLWRGYFTRKVASAQGVQQDLTDVTRTTR